MAGFREGGEGVTTRVPIDGPRDRFAELEAIKGETYSGEFGLFNSDGVTPVELNGYTLTMYVWEGPTLKETVECEAGDEDGWVTASMSAAVTGALNPVAHHFEIWSDNGEGQIKLVLWGWLWVKGSCPQ